jgi:hypothetical protein
MPFSLIENTASASGKQGESNILHTRVLPRPFRMLNLINILSVAGSKSSGMSYRVVDACATIFPPMGFFGSA